MQNFRGNELSLQVSTFSFHNEYYKNSNYVQTIREKHFNVPQGNKSSYKQ